MALTVPKGLTCSSGKKNHPGETDDPCGHELVTVAFRTDRGVPAFLCPVCDRGSLEQAVSARS